MSDLHQILWRTSDSTRSIADIGRRGRCVHLIQHVRHLRAHGYGKLTVEVARNRVVQCRSEQSDNPGDLISLQETEGPGV
jgi:hypothetical protein